MMTAWKDTIQGVDHGNGCTRTFNVLFPDERRAQSRRRRVCSTIEMKEGAKSLEARGVPDQSVSERY